MEGPTCYYLEERDLVDIKRVYLVDDEEEVFHIYYSGIYVCGDQSLFTTCGFNVGFQCKWISTEEQL